MLKVIVAGTRTFNNLTYLCDRLDTLLKNKQVEIISGGAPGTDSLAEQYAQINDIPLTVIQAEWSLHGKAAGPKRNAKMVAMGDVLVAFWDNQSRGTQNIIQLAKKKGLEVHIISIP